jgi:HD-GYP domain-containing protein (c-di-GMP phosphodiesterase class II)
MVRVAEYAGVCTPGRGKRVAATAVQLGRQIGMGSARLATLADTALVLDIGLIGLPVHVAQQSEPLTEEEEAAYQLHPMRGLELVRELPVGFEALNGVMHHHERHDGLGYPMGLSGREIPEFARILAICDAYEDMVSRTTGARLPIEAQVRELYQLVGTQLDPVLFTTFTEVMTAAAANRSASR